LYHAEDLSELFKYILHVVVQPGRVYDLSGPFVYILLFGQLFETFCLRNQTIFKLSFTAILIK